MLSHQRLSTFPWAWSYLVSERSACCQVASLLIGRSENFLSCRICNYSLCCSISALGLFQQFTGFIL